MATVDESMKSDVMEEVSQEKSTGTVNVNDEPVKKERAKSEKAIKAEEEIKAKECELNKKQNEPLYCWMVGKDFSIKKFVIKEYSNIGNDTPRPEISFVFDFGSGKSVNNVRESNVGCFVYRKYYSFNNSDEEAIKSIKNAINSEYERLKIDFEKYSKFREGVFKKLENPIGGNSNEVDTEK